MALDDGEPRYVFTMMAYIPEGAPPTNPIFEFTLGPEITLVDQRGHSLKSAVLPASVCTGDCKKPADSASAGQTPADAAEIIITPVQPPCGKYPEGTVISGRDIRLPRGDVTVYFDVMLRHWGRAAQLEAAKELPEGQ